jgi:hypothetical protein
LKSKELEAYCPLRGELILLSSTTQPEYRSWDMRNGVFGAGGVSSALSFSLAHLKSGKEHSMPCHQSNQKPETQVSRQADQFGHNLSILHYSSQLEAGKK